MKIHIEIEIDVDYDYQPQEPATQTYPGCDAEIAITSVMLNGLQLQENLGKETMDYLLQECMFETQKESNCNE